MWAEGGRVALALHTGAGSDSNRRTDIGNGFATRIETAATDSEIVHGKIGVRRSAPPPVDVEAVVIIIVVQHVGMTIRAVRSVSALENRAALINLIFQHANIFRHKITRIGFSHILGNTLVIKEVLVQPSGRIFGKGTRSGGIVSHLYRNANMIDQFGNLIGIREWFIAHGIPIVRLLRKIHALDAISLGGVHRGPLTLSGMTMVVHDLRSGQGRTTIGHAVVVTRPSFENVFRFTAKYNF